MYNIVIKFLYTLQNGHQNKSSYHLSHYKVNTVPPDFISYAVHYIPMAYLFSAILCPLTSILTSLHFSHSPAFNNHESMSLAVKVPTTEFSHVNSHEKIRQCHSA